MKRLKSIISIALVLGVMILLFTNQRLCQSIDGLVLLEGRNPAYYEYLLNHTEYYVSKDSIDKPNNNLLVNSIPYNSFENKGATICIHKDGSFSFSGEYTGETPTFTYQLRIGDLATGDYRLSDGDASVENGIQIRFYGVKELPDKSIKYGNCLNLPGNGVFHWESGEYDYACMDVMIYPGFSRKVDFYPMLQKAKEVNSVFQAAIRMYQNLPEYENMEDYLKCKIITIDKAELSALNQQDWQLFRNALKYQSGVCWTTLDFGDGTGIQIPLNNISEMQYGEIDASGRVRFPLEDDMHIIEKIDG